MDASYQKDRRAKIKKDKEERRRLSNVRGNESRARRKVFSFSFTSTSETADNEEEDEVDEPKWSVGDYVVVEDSRVGSSRKLFWEIL